MGGELKVLVVEDNLHYAQSLVTLISMCEGMVCIGCLHSAESFQTQDGEAEVPDVVLLDLNLPGRGGLSLIPLIQKVCETTKILVITQEDSHLKTLEAIRLGVNGYILKESSLELIKQAIFDVWDGGCVIDHQLCGYVLKALDGFDNRNGDIVSEREREVLELLALGYTKKEIADQLDLSYSRIAKATERIFEKLRVTNIASAIATAIRRGII